MCKIFADYTSLFSKVQDLNKSVTELNTDLKLPDNALLSVYKSFTRPYLDYGYILYNNQAMIILGTKWKKFNIELVYQ